MRLKDMITNLLPPFQEIDISSETTFEACERQIAGWLFLKIKK